MVRWDRCSRLRIARRGQFEGWNGIKDVRALSMLGMVSEVTLSTKSIRDKLNFLKGYPKLY